MSLRSALGRVKGLGPAGEGVDHWWTHRMSSLALVPLTVWLIASLVALAGADFFEIRAWMSSPVVAGLLILCVLVGFHHSSMSLQVVIEDYVHSEPVKLAAIIAVKAVNTVLGLIGVLSILIVLFKS